MVDKLREPAPEAALLDRFRQGDPAAFEEIVRANRSAVYAVARRVLGSHEDADEAAQATFVKAWRALGRFRGDSAIRTWLIRIALNVSRSMRSSRRVAERLDRAEGLVDPRESSEAVIGRREARRRLRRIVAGLPPRQREVVILKVFSEMTYRDVAGVMQLSEGAVKAHLHQAVSNLRRRMAALAKSGAG